MTGFTDDTLLGGRVALRQPAKGFRAAVDAVLLAAFIPARGGQRVLEAGCGTGAGFLCLAARVPGLAVTAIERDAEAASLARHNAVQNGLSGRASIIAGDIADGALAELLGRYDHAFANPPFWPGGTASPDPRRAAATHEAEADLGAWVRFLARGLTRGGTLSLILPAGRFDDGIAAMKAAGCGGILLLPVAPHAGQPARRALLRGRLQSKAPAMMLPALVLHGPVRGYTEEAERVLRRAEALPLTPA